MNEQHATRADTPCADASTMASVGACCTATSTVTPANTPVCCGSRDAADAAAACCDPAAKADAVAAHAGCCR